MENSIFTARDAVKLVNKIELRRLDSDSNTLELLKSRSADSISPLKKNRPGNAVKLQIVHFLKYNSSEIIPEVIEPVDIQSIDFQRALQS